MRAIAWSGLALAAVLATGGCGGTSSASKAPVDSDPRPAGPEMIAIPAIAISSAPGDVESGKAVFAKKGCPACHKIGGGKLVGPDLLGVTARRNPRWIERMILHPETMIQIDETARGLLKTHLVPMANQQVKPD
ncbi:MAG: c-type cytochrome, partial [Ilumatobacteraceae bacterium]